jgi:hypothetical protein
MRISLSANNKISAKRARSEITFREHLIGRRGQSLIAWRQQLPWLRWSVAAAPLSLSHLADSPLSGLRMVVRLAGNIQYSEGIERRR